MAAVLTDSQKRIKDRNDKIISKYLELKELGTLNEKAMSEAARLNKVTTRTVFNVLKASGYYQTRKTK